MVYDPFSHENIESQVCKGTKLRKHVSQDVKGEVKFGCICQKQNDSGQVQQCVNKQHQNQKSHNSTFFIRGDTAGRQGFKGPTQEKHQQWKREEEADTKDNRSDLKVNQENNRKNESRRKEPDHDTDHHRGLDGSSEVVPQWAGDDQKPAIQDGHTVLQDLQNYVVI